MGIWTNVKWAFGWPSKLIRLLARPIDVLVIGAAHIDTTGEVEDTTSFINGTDQEGRIIYAVGGGGYNIAVNLAAAGKNHHVALDTLLPKESRLADVVSSKLVFNGVSLDYVRRLSIKDQKEFVQAAMGGRVEIRGRHGRMLSVSRTLVDTPEYWTRNRDRLAVHRAKALVVDTYLFEAAAREVVQRAVEKRTPLFVFATTDSTARRFARSIADRTLRAEGAVLCLAGTADVLEAMSFEIDGNEQKHAERVRLLQSKSTDPNSAKDLCRLLRTRYVACIHDMKAVVFAWTGEQFRVDMKDIEVVNQKGASDALMAAVVDVFLSHGGRSVGTVGAQEILDLQNADVTDALYNEIRYHVRRAVGSLGATQKSVISFEEPFDSWRLLLERQFKYWGLQVLNGVLWLLILAALNLAAKLFGLDHLYRVPLKQLTTMFGIVGQALKTGLGAIFGH
jgi:sugar/nucleoside kinase (ribokinase family)